ncbi:hypothetical protein ABT010_18730 [Streptomyces sp. NPDC002668]|uniref:hypothetical protein n=1 Tax=Streptomyces sp. NPDC002668 TaxID=3154422 RepID=UPI0033276412
MATTVVAGVVDAYTAAEEDGPEERATAWTFDGPVHGELTVAGRTVFVSMIGPDLLRAPEADGVAACDPATGRVRWQVPAARGTYSLSFALGADALLLAGPRGNTRLYARRGRRRPAPERPGPGRHDHCGP